MPGQNPYAATPSAANQLIPKLLEYRQVSPYVIYQQQGFTMSKLMNILATPTNERAGNRVIEQYTIGNTLPTATIASRVAVGGLLTIGWSNPQYDGFIVNETMKSATDKVGKVVSHTAGSVTIQPLDGAFDANDFAVGAVVNTLGNMSGPGSYGPESKYYMPDERFNYVGTTRANVTLTRDDLSARTWVEVDGQPYWNYAQMDIAIRDFNRINDMRIWNGERINAGGEGYMTGGLKWQMKNQGATLDPRTGQLTENGIGDLFEKMLNNGNSTATEFVGVVGSSWLKQFQRNVARDYIVTAGTTNTVGGKEVVGLNAMVYACQGIEFKLIAMPSWNNRAAYGTPSLEVPGTTIEANNAWFIDPTDVMTSQGKKPFLQKFYYSPNMDMGVVEIDGMIDQNGTWVKKAANSRDAFSIELIEDCAILLADPTKQVFSFISE